MSKLQYARIRYLYKLMDSYPKDRPVMDASHMSGLAKSIFMCEKWLQRIGERECNGVIGPDGFAKWDDADQLKADKERALAITRITAAFWELLGPDLMGGELEFQGDPRGCMVQYHGPDKRTWYFSADDFK